MYLRSRCVQCLRPSLQANEFIQSTFSKITRNTWNYLTACNFTWHLSTYDGWRLHYDGWRIQTGCILEIGSYKLLNINTWKRCKIEFKCWICHLMKHGNIVISAARIIAEDISEDKIIKKMDKSVQKRCQTTCDVASAMYAAQAQFIFPEELTLHDSVQCALIKPDDKAIVSIPLLFRFLKTVLCEEKLCVQLWKTHLVLHWTQSYQYSRAARSKILTQILSLHTTERLVRKLRAWPGICAIAIVATSVADETISPGTTAMVCVGLCWMNLMIPAKLPSTSEVKPELLPMKPGKGSPATQPMRLGRTMHTGNCRLL